MTYSIAIRTLGTAGEKFRQELLSIAAQTVPPDRVVVYIAEGYPRPEFSVGKEEYVWVKKGMVAQRALRYDEIESDCVLMLDDDVRLAPDSAAKLLEAVEKQGFDCVAADVFENHKMPFSTKLKAALVNWVFPHFGNKWAFKMHRTGSFSYNWRPEPRCYPSQTCGGPTMMWRKDSFLKIHYEDELWMDSFGFAYGDDALLSYKLHVNGGKLGVLYDSGVKNLDAGSSSSGFKKSPEWIKVRTLASYMAWWRMCYRNGEDTAWSRLLATILFGLKSIWLFLLMMGLSITRLDFKVLSSYVAGWHEGRRMCRRGFFDGNNTAFQYSGPACSLPGFDSSEG